MRLDILSLSLHVTLSHEHRSQAIHWGSKRERGRALLRHNREIIEARFMSEFRRYHSLRMKRYELWPDHAFIRQTVLISADERGRKWSKSRSRGDVTASVGYFGKIDSKDSLSFAVVISFVLEVRAEAYLRLLMSDASIHL
jgi:hypothetical protein